MKRLIIMVALLLSTATLAAQSVQQYRTQLAQSDPATAGRVTVVEHGSAAKAVQLHARKSTPDKIRGYRICILFDNSQNARENAMAAQSRFKSLFPNIPIYTSYENPWFRVLVGNCLTDEEALILLETVKGEFGGAYKTNEELPIKIFYNN